MFDRAFFIGFLSYKCRVSVHKIELKIIEEMAISFVMHTFCTMPGYLTASIALDCIIFLKLLYLAHVMVIPALSSFWRGKRLDKIAGTSKKHWFFGHTKEVYRFSYLQDSTD